MAGKLAPYPYLTKIAYNLFFQRYNTKALMNIDAHSYLWGYNDTLLTLVHDIIPGYITTDKIGLLDYVSVYLAL